MLQKLQLQQLLLQVEVRHGVDRHFPAEEVGVVWVGAAKEAQASKDFKKVGSTMNCVS